MWQSFYKKRHLNYLFWSLSHLNNNSFFNTESNSSIKKIDSILWYVIYYKHTYTYYILYIVQNIICNVLYLPISILNNWQLEYDLEKLIEFIFSIFMTNVPKVFIVLYWFIHMITCKTIRWVTCDEIKVSGTEIMYQLFCTKIWTQMRARNRWTLTAVWIHRIFNWNFVDWILTRITRVY